MKTTKSALILFGSISIWIALVLGHVSSVRSEGQDKRVPEKTRVTEQNRSAQGVVLGYLESRNKVVVISRGPKGTVYSVRSRDGKILDAKLSEKELKRKHPEIHSQIEHGLAGNDATIRTKDLPILHPAWSQPPR